MSKWLLINALIVACFPAWARLDDCRLLLESAPGKLVHIKMQNERWYSGKLEKTESTENGLLVWLKARQAPLNLDFALEVTEGKLRSIKAYDAKIGDVILRTDGLDDGSDMHELHVLDVDKDFIYVGNRSLRRSLATITEAIPRENSSRAEVFQRFRDEP